MESLFKLIEKPVGAITYECYLDGRSYIRKCTNCGNGSLTLSFYGNCEGQRDICNYILDFSLITEDGIKQFCNRYNMRKITLKKLICMKKVIQLKCEISDALEEEEFFNKIGLGYVMEPPIPYSHFYTCKDAIRSKWLNRTIEVVIEE